MGLWDTCLNSCVIYLQKVGDVPEPPLTWELTEDEQILTFHFLSLKLAEMSVEQLKALGLHGLAPLFILAQGGISHQGGGGKCR